MADSRLKAHYDEKYAHEAAGGGQAGAALPSARPVDRFAAAASFIPPRLTGGDVLELGAGDGRVARALLRDVPGIRSYTLGDISVKRLAGLKASIDDARVKVVEMDAEDVDGGGRTFDAVVMIALIEHLIDPMGALARIRRVLRPGGFVYIDTPNIAKYTRRALLLAGRFPSTSSKNEGLTTYGGAPADLYDEGHLHYFTYRSLTLMLTSRCGYSRVDKLGYPCGKLFLGRRLESALARLWPEVFSELVVVAYN